ALTYAVASGLAVSPERHIAHLHWIAAHNPFNPAFTPTFAPTAAGYRGLLYKVVSDVICNVGVLMLATAVLAVPIIWRTGRADLALLLPALGHLVAVILPVRLSMLRYVMPIAVVVCLLAARSLGAGLRSTRPIAAASWIIIAAICITQF